MVRFFVIRHSEREDHVNISWQNASHRPHDSPLSLNGRGMVKECAEYVEKKLQAVLQPKENSVNEKRPMVLTFTSPLVRCVTTAKLLVDALGLTKTVSLKVEEGLAEANRFLRPRMMGTHRESKMKNALTKEKRSLVKPVLLGPGDLVETAQPVQIDFSYTYLHPLAFDKKGYEIDVKSKKVVQTDKVRLSAFIPKLLAYVEKLETEQGTGELVCFLVTHGAVAHEIVDILTETSNDDLGRFEYLQTVEVAPAAASTDTKISYETKSNWRPAMFDQSKGSAAKLA